jgi:phage shock protein PspC (stress-responsive transcriptional regulator)
MDQTQPCPYCSEEIPATALRCRYCRSRLAPLDPARWHRDHPERRIAGVAAAVAHALAFPVAAVRLGFLVLTFFHLLGPILYGALWLLIPPAPGGESLSDRGIRKARDAVAHARAQCPRPTPPADRPPGSDGSTRPSTLHGGMAS